MATVLYPPNYVAPATSTHTVFLAGAIDMGAAVDWQAYVIRQLESVATLTLFNPRRAAFTPEMEVPQILWELSHLELAEEIFMWFPASATAPVAMLETGLYLKSGKLRLGVEPGFYRRTNLILTADRFGGRVYDSLDEMIVDLVDRFES